MRAKDWSQTPPGPVEKWPQSLLTSLSICLDSRFPIVMYWGPEFVVLYNDAYSTILGTKHPWALGQRCWGCWSEIWDTIGPMLEGVVQTASIRINRDCTEQAIVVKVSDRGEGIPGAVIYPSGPTKPGVGIQGMRERVRQLGGQIEIRSVNPGTEILAIFPVRPPRAIESRS
jgi:hypothetical protein